MPTLEIRVSDVIRVIDVVPAIVKFVVRIVKQIYAEIVRFIAPVFSKINRGRAPPINTKLDKGKGGSRS